MTYCAKCGGSLDSGRRCQRCGETKASSRGTTGTVTGLQGQRSCGVTKCGGRCGICRPPVASETDEPTEMEMVKAYLDHLHRYCCDLAMWGDRIGTLPRSPEEFFAAPRKTGKRAKGGHK